jgi:hypothetical protein
MIRREVEGKDDCKCGFHNFQTRLNCMSCNTSKSYGTILNKTNMKWRKSKKKTTIPVTSNNLVGKLVTWWRLHPCGRTVSVPLHTNLWVETLLNSVLPSAMDAHVHHTITSKWKFFKINLGYSDHLIHDPAWLPVPPTICISAVC